VIAEFVVDAEGHIEPSTLVIVSSTHPLFTAAVDSALAGALFRPATLGGRHVRQVVQLPVYFALPGKEGN
jgi:outer membrane biosynthesis protein TonB